MPLVKYRVHADRAVPSPIRIAVPGWTGTREPRPDGSHEQPWHCIPFSESARYRLELLYPYEQELRVTSLGGQVDVPPPPGVYHHHHHHHY